MFPVLHLLVGLALAAAGIVLYVFVRLRQMKKFLEGQEVKIPIPTPIAGTNDLEYRYSQRGPHMVGTLTVRDNEREYIIFYPEPLKGRFPVVVWSNGSNGSFQDYEETMKCLASYGFVVADNDDPQTGSGKSVYETALFMERLEQDDTGILFGHMDLTRMGVCGHSQGGCGAVNAATKYRRSKELFKSLCTSSMPNLEMCRNRGLMRYAYWKYDLSLVTIPYFMNGGDGKFDAEMVCPVNCIRKNYDALPSGVPAVMAIRLGANHNVVNKEYGCGAMNAWFLYTLTGDETARKVFEEMKRNSIEWSNVAVKCL